MTASKGQLLPVIAAALIIASVLGGGLGLLFLSNATTGVGLIGLACLSAMLARIAQAAYHWANR